MVTIGVDPHKQTTPPPRSQLGVSSPAPRHRRTGASWCLGPGAGCERVWVVEEPPRVRRLERFC